MKYSYKIRHGITIFILKVMTRFSYSKIFFNHFLSTYYFHHHKNGHCSTISWLIQIQTSIMIITDVQQVTTSSVKDGTHKSECTQQTNESSFRCGVAPRPWTHTHIDCIHFCVLYTPILECFYPRSCPGLGWPHDSGSRRMRVARPRLECIRCTNAHSGTKVYWNCTIEVRICVCVCLYWRNVSWCWNVRKRTKCTEVHCCALAAVACFGRLCNAILLWFLIFLRLRWVQWGFIVWWI